MLKYVTRRLLLLIPLLFVVSLIVFSMVHLMPGDPAEIIAGEAATPEDIENVRQSLGFDKPLHEQYLTWMGRAVRGNFGTSIRTGRPVAQEIGFRFVNTVILSVVSIVFSTTLGIAAGIISATRRYSLYDNITMVVALVGISVAPFYLGLMLMLLFSVKLGWFPLMGFESWVSIILPAVTLGARPVGMIARMTRSSMLEVLGQDYIVTARAQGMPERIVIFKHALRNALTTIVTVVGLQFGQQLGGAILTETVFAWPGIGRLAVESINARDFPIVQASVLLLATSFVLINLAVDVLYAYVNPRVRYN
ncbi:MAG: ABC transporter permease [bacterium]|jgi:ABC-type dipeptide/oligopeptide/nickel transport system permease component